MHFSVIVGVCGTLWVNIPLVRVSICHSSGMNVVCCKADLHLSFGYSVILLASRDNYYQLGLV